MRFSIDVAACAGLKKDSHRGGITNHVKCGLIL